MMALSLAERREALALAALIVPYVPANIANTWMSVPPRFCSKPNVPGIGAVAYADNAAAV